MHPTKKRAVILCAAIAILLCLGGLARLFLIGEPIRGDEVFCTVTENEGRLHLRITTSDSGLAFRFWRLRQREDVLYISGRKTLCSPLFGSGTQEFDINPGSFEKIVLGNTVLWSRENSI